MEVPEDVLRQNETLKKRLFDRQATAVLILCLILIPTNLLRILDTGFLPVYAIQGLAILICLGMFFFRTHLNPRAVALTITAVMVIGLLAGVATFGILAAGHSMIPIVIVLASILFGRGAGIWLLAIFALGLVVFAALHMSGVMDCALAVQHYAHSWVSWLVLFVAEVWAAAGYLFIFQPIVETQKRTSEHLAAVFQGINDALFIHDKDTGVILQVNEKMCAMYGYSAEEAVRLRVEDLSAGVPPYTQKEAQAWMALAVKQGPQLFEWRAKDRAGRLFWVEVGMRLANLEGPERLLVVVRDISERKHQATERVRLEEETKAFDILVTNLLAQIVRDDGSALDEIICSGLGEIARYLGADLALIIQLQDGGTTYSVTHEWCASDRESRKQQIQKVPLGANPWAVKKILENQSIVVSRLSDIPPEAEESRRRWQAMGFRSHMQVPFRGRGGVVLGSLSVATLSHEVDWQQEDARRLTLLADAMASAIERKQAEERLRDSTSRYETLVENSPDIIARFDRNLRYLFVNSTIAKVSPIKPENFKGKTMLEVGFTKEQADAREAKIREVIAGAVPAEAEFEFLARGERRIYEWRAYPERDAAGTVESVLTLNRDITERKRADEEHRQLQARLGQAQKMEAIGTLAGGIAHDFNNILSAILGCNDLAMQKCTDEEQLDDLKMVGQAARRAVDLVKQILDFSRMSKEEAKPVQPRLIVREALKLLRASIPATVEIRDNLLSKALVLAEPGEIHRMVINLCTNAALAMQGTGGILDLGLDEVELDAQFVDTHPGIATGRFVRLTVKDTGCGMTEEVKARIYEPYFTTRQSGEGTGMGLAVVHGVVHNRGGTLSVASTPGQGTTFQVFLPVATLSTAVEDLSEELPPTGSERILLVDDEPILVDVASRSLARLGYKVTPMTSSLDAVERFKTAPGDFDVVVTDMTMPKMTGDELAAALRAIRPDIPIILCSGYSERLRSAKAGGVDAFAYKPVAAGALSRLIRKVMQDRFKVAIPR